MQAQISYHKIQKVLQIDEHPAVQNIVIPPKGNDQVEAYIKFVKHTIKKYLDTNQDVKFGLFADTHNTYIYRVPNPVMMLFSRPIRGLLPHVSRE